MIVWIDGVLGIGKSTTAQNLWQKHLRSNGELLDSDEYFTKLCNADIRLTFCSIFANDNPLFLQRFRSVIEQKVSSSNKDLIVTIALIRQESKKYLFDPLISQNIPTLHFVLTANRDKTPLVNVLKCLQRLVVQHLVGTHLIYLALSVYG